MHPLAFGISALLWVALAVLVCYAAALCKG
jgi:hypothetical protein